MAKLTQSQSILLGKALEKCFAPAMEASNISFVFSESYNKVLTRPDYLILESGVPVAAVAVTCTLDMVAMSMKRWRYIDEVAQLKSYFGPDFVVINCEFGDPEKYLKGEIALLNVFFDASILAYQIDGGEEFLNTAVSAVKIKGTTTDAVLAKVMSNSVSKQVTRGIVKKLKSILAQRNLYANNNKLYRIWEKDSKQYKERICSLFKNERRPINTSFRKCVISGLVMGDAVTRELIEKACNGKVLSPNTVNLCKKYNLQIQPSIKGYILSDIDFINTVKAGLNYDLYSQISKVLLSNNEVKGIVEEINNEEIVHKMVEHTLEIITSPQNLASALKESYKQAYKGIENNHVWVLDVCAVYLDLTLHDINTLYITEFGREQIANMAMQFVNKNEIGKAFFSNETFLIRYCECLSTVLSNELRQLSERLTEEEICKRYIERKLESLGHQTFVNPLHRYVELVFQKNNLSFNKKGIPCILKGINSVPARAQRINEVYRVSINGQELWIKAVAGYNGVKDKTREMAARARMLRYGSCNGDERTATTIFVADGKWDSNLQNLLLLAGWDYVVPVFQFEKFFSELISKFN